MFVLGLTGSIAMGKSTAAAMFRQQSVPVHDADRAVHQLLARGGGAVAAIETAFPGVVIDGAVDRPALGRRVFGDTQALRMLETIIHPLVVADRNRFLGEQARRHTPVVVLDIPLLFETGADAACDAVVVVSAPSDVQLARLLKRPGMDRERVTAILSRQMSDTEKRRRADFVVPTGRGRAPTWAAIRSILASARARSRGKRKISRLFDRKHRKI